MLTTLRRIGNSQGVLIPATMLAESGITGEINLRLEDGRIIIEPVRKNRVGWFAAYRHDIEEANAAETALWDQVDMAATTAPLHAVNETNLADDDEWSW